MPTPITPPDFEPIATNGAVPSEWKSKVIQPGMVNHTVIGSKPAPDPAPE